MGHKDWWKKHDQAINQTKKYEELLSSSKKPSPTLSPQKVDCPQYTFDPLTPDQIRQNNKLWRDSVEFVKRKKLTFLVRETLELHRSNIEEIETQGIPGMIIECGVAKAGSSITFTAMKRTSRCLHLHDTFSGIPPPSVKDGADVHKRYSVIKSGRAGKDYYGYDNKLLQHINYNFNEAKLSPEENFVTFHQGLFNETVWPEGPVAYAHLDGDWYESTMGMLQRIDPFLSIGGYFVLDDAST